MVECNLCGCRGAWFQRLDGEEGVCCPRCGAQERHRAIARYFDRAALLGRPGTVLEIGPASMPAFRRYFEPRGWRYFSVDLWPGAGEVLGDNLRLPFRDAAFDLVLSYHVLEHVANDYTAMQEMARVTRPGGAAMLQVPYDDTRFATVETDALRNPELPWDYYYHHKRNYGLDIIDRCGRFWAFVAEINPLLVVPLDEARRYGFARNYGTTFFCSASAPAVPLAGTMRRDLIPLKRHWLTELRANERFRSLGGRSRPLDDWLTAESEVNRLAPDVIARCGPWQEGN